MKRILAGVFAASLSLAAGRTAALAQSASPLEHAKALYDSASFDEALTVLNGLERTEPETDVEEVQRYRALCLLALSRNEEAQSAIEIVFSRDPLYKMSEGEAPPRMRAAFNEVRRRLLPKVTEQLYAAAKLSFDRKEFPLAATQFTDLLTFLEDADARELPSLQEFRTLAKGFRDLSTAVPAVAKTDPPPVTARSDAAPTPASNATAAPASEVAPGPVPPAPGAAATQGPAAVRSQGVLVPPVTLKQQMPLWLGAREFMPRGNHGMVRIIVDEQGNVEEARVVESVHPVYDALLLSAARTWKYEAAKLDGKPVRYVKVIEVVLKPQ